MLDNEKFRIDNEFFKKEYINAYKFVKKMKHSTIRDIIACLTDFHANGSYEIIAQNFKLLDEPDYAYMVRSTDLETQNYETGVKYISENAYNFLSKSKIYGGELLINKIGIPGKSYLMPKLNKPVSLGMNLFLLKLKPNCGVNEYYLWAFLNSRIGSNIIKRKINGTMPLSIDKEAIKSLYIPIINIDIQNRIRSLIMESQKIFNDSKSLYRQAEELLLEAIGLKDFQPTNKNKSIKTFKESFLTTGRLDAEYYQPKYEEIISKVKQQEYDLLSNLVSIKKSIEPGSEAYSDEGLPFLRVSDYNKFGISEPEKKLSDNFYNANRTLINSLKPKKETILFSKDGSAGTAYLLYEDANFITSGAILHLNIKDKKVLPEYLTLTLNSKVVQQQAEHDAGGSIILHWRVDEIKKVVIPIIDIKIQRKIAELIEKSFKLRTESERLLKEAKEAVEKEITNC
ncbi:MAG: restriction endonuclease subunit S [Endomicrobium sp.]|nr:restriction endonuclease subunit S [Endomicrobium sp.]